MAASHEQALTPAVAADDLARVRSYADHADVVALVVALEPHRLLLRVEHPVLDALAFGVAPGDALAPFAVLAAVARGRLAPHAMHVAVIVSQTAASTQPSKIEQLVAHAVPLRSQA